MKTPRILIVSPQSHSFVAALLSRAVSNYSPPVDVVSIREGDTIELGEGDICIIDTARPEITTEQLKVLTMTPSFELERQLPPKSTGCEQGTAFYMGVKSVRRHNRRRRKVNPTRAARS